MQQHHHAPRLPLGREDPRGVPVDEPPAGHVHGGRRRVATPTSSPPRRGRRGRRPSCRRPAPPRPAPRPRTPPARRAGRGARQKRVSCEPSTGPGSGAVSTCASTSSSRRMVAFRALVGVVGVEHREDPLAGARERAQRLDPGGQLLDVVHVVEALAGHPALAVPRSRVAAVEAHVGRRRGVGHDGLGDVGALDPRRVDRHVRQPGLRELVERLLTTLLRQPVALAELDQHRVAGAAARAPICDRPRATSSDGARPGGYCIRTPPSRPASRRAGASARLEAPEHALGAAPATDRRGRATSPARPAVAGRAGSCSGVHAVPGHQPEGLHVEHEAVGRALGPVRRGRGPRGWRSTTGVDLDRVVALRVSERRRASAVFRSRRIPAWRAGPGSAQEQVPMTDAPSAIGARIEAVTWAHRSLPAGTARRFEPDARGPRAGPAGRRSCAGGRASGSSRAQPVGGARLLHAR